MAKFNEKELFDKCERYYRKLSDFLATFNEDDVKKIFKENKKNASLLCVKYEEALCYKTAFFLVCLNLKYKEIGRLISYHLFLRRTLESSCIEDLLKTDYAVPVNYRIFELQFFNRQIGESERLKLSKQIHIKPKYINDYVISTNRPFYLLGIIDNIDTPRHLFTYVESKALEEDDSYYEEKKTVVTGHENYDILGLFAHFGISAQFLGENLDAEFYDLSHTMDMADDSFKLIFKAIKKIESKRLIFEEKSEFSEVFEKLSSNFEMLYDEFIRIDCVTESLLVREFIQAIYLLYYGHINNLDFELIPQIKVFYEKMSLFNRILNSSYEDKDELINDFNSCVLYNVLEVVGDNIEKPDDIKNLHKDLYKKYNEKFNNHSFHDFSRYLVQNPTYLIDKQMPGFNKQIDEYLKLINPERAGLYLNLYLISCELTHPSGLLMKHHKIDKDKIYRLYLESLMDIFDYMFVYIDRGLKIIDFRYKEIETDKKAFINFFKRDYKEVFNKFATSISSGYNNVKEDELIDKNLNVVDVYDD